MDKLALQILRYRARNNLTQEEFAQKCHLSRQTVMLIESGKTKHAVSRLVRTKIEMVLSGIEI